MDDILTYMVLLAMVYAGLLKIGVFRHLPNVAQLANGVSRFVATIPWTPPQAAAQQEAKKQAAQQPQVDRRYVISQHHKIMERRIKKIHARRIAVPAVSVSPEPIAQPVMSSAAPRYIPLDDFQQEHARFLMIQGWSNNKIYKVWGGTRAKRMAEIESVRRELDAENLAKSIAKPDTIVPPAESVESALAA